MVEKYHATKITLKINGTEQMLTMGCCALEIPNLLLNCCIMFNF